MPDDQQTIALDDIPVGQKPLYRMLFQILEENRQLREMVESIYYRQNGEEWLDLQAWESLTGEKRDTAKHKCQRGEYKIRPRESDRSKFFIHRSELNKKLTG